MPVEIGKALREARMRRKVDVGAVEDQTKIRAKYLRALENEEWELLPGPAYVRSFLRTYAQFLDLDAQLLVDEFRRREGEGEETYPYAEPPLREPPLPKRSERRRRERTPIAQPRAGPRIPRGVVVAAVFAGLFALLLVLGLTSGGEDEEVAAPETSRERRAERQKQKQQRREARRERRRRAAAGTVQVRLTAKEDVWVCLVGRGDKLLVPGEIVAGGSSKGPFKGKRFQLSLGNGFVSLKLGDRQVKVPDSSNPLGYTLSPKGARRLAEDELPSCA